MRRVGSKAVDASPAVGPYALLVLSALVAVAIVFLGRMRTHSAHVNRRGAGFRALLPVALASFGSIATIERLGFVLTASGLFWVTARAFDATHPARDAIWAAALSIGAYFLFARLLELPLPSGVFSSLL